LKVAPKHHEIPARKVTNYAGADVDFKKQTAASFTNNDQHTLAEPLTGFTTGARTPYATATLILQCRAGHEYRPLGERTRPCSTSPDASQQLRSIMRCGRGPRSVTRLTFNSPAWDSDTAVNVSISKYLFYGVELVEIPY
jgi:hypothetical protein